MNKKLVICTLFLSLFLVSINSVNADSEKRECGDMKWKDHGHDDNNPSSNDFKKSAYDDSLCELSKKVDHAQVTNHDSVNWKKFKQSPAYQNSTDDQQNCLSKAHKDGNGANGLVGYEILYCGIDNDE